MFPLSAGAASPSIRVSLLARGLRLPRRHSGVPVQAAHMLGTRGWVAVRNPSDLERRRWGGSITPRHRCIPEVTG